MHSQTERIRKLARGMADLIEQEQRAFHGLFASLEQSLRDLHTDTADRRLMRLLQLCTQLKERYDLLMKLTRDDFLAKIRDCSEQMDSGQADHRLAAVLRKLLPDQAFSLNSFCRRLLDQLIDLTGAERGFVLFYRPESTEAEIVAAHHFRTTHLSLEEYSFSRSLLAEVFRTGRPLLLEDAGSDPAFSQESSVKALNIKSVLAVPLQQGNRAAGALYLENGSLPCAFDKADCRLLQEAARFAIFLLHHARLLPVLFEPDRRVFLDSDRASREIIGQDPKILELLATVSQIADSKAAVLIEGESGTGKELVARALHYQSLRRQGPFAAINCAALPETLVESELFGHEKGAFTGASERYIGRLEQGRGGTVFLDEINEMAFSSQAKLLRFLQSDELRRLGGKQTIRVDARIVAASSKSLKSLAESNRFQPALYYRLNVIPLCLPPLRERRGDIPLLLDHFLEKHCAEYGKKLRVQPEVYDWLQGYEFSGNVRELENLVHRLVALATEETIRIGDLPREILQTASRKISLAKDPMLDCLSFPPASLEDLQQRRKIVQDALAEQKCRLIEQAVQQVGSVTEAAGRLGVHRVTLQKWLRGCRVKKKPSQEQAGPPSESL